MTLIVIILLAFFATDSLVVGEIFNDPHYVRGHSAIVHLFEWKWSDIADECESFLGPMGYGGVQVSPVQENLMIPSRPWWERYQPISFRLVTRSGNESEFRNMVRRCNNAGVRIYVDAIINHMCADTEFEAIGTGGTKAYPSSKNYPEIPFNKDDFHETCSINDYNNVVEVRNCELVGLHDLDQSIENVREKIVNFMNTVIDIGVAGFRIDAAKHMWPIDLQIIYSRLHNLSINHGFHAGDRPYIYQEVIDLGGEAIPAAEYKEIAAVTEFKYGHEVANGVRGYNPLKWFKNVGEEWSMLPHQDAIVFIDNHDTQRGSALTYKQSKLYKMAVAFMLAHPYGNPKIMSSFAFNSSDQGPPADTNGSLISPVIKNENKCRADWICEHRWRQIYNMIRFRNVVNGSAITEWWDNGNNQIAFSRGDAGFIAINADNYDLKREIHTKLPTGLYCDVISGNIKNGTCTGKTVVIRSNGFAYIEILSNEVEGVLAIDRSVKL